MEEQFQDRPSSGQNERFAGVFAASERGSCTAAGLYRREAPQQVDEAVVISFAVKKGHDVGEACRPFTAQSR